MLWLLAITSGRQRLFFRWPSVALVDREALVVSDTDVAYRELAPAKVAIASLLGNLLDLG